MRIHGRCGSVVFAILRAMNLVRRSVGYDKEYS